MSKNKKKLNKTDNAVTDDHAITPREVRAAKLGHAWARNPANKIELQRLIEWRLSLTEEEDLVFDPGEERFDVTEAGMTVATILEGSAMDFARECWADRLCLESNEVVQPEEVCAFINAAAFAWLDECIDKILGEIRNEARAEAMRESAHRGEHGKNSTIQWADVSIQRVANCPTYTPALKRRSD